MLITKFNKMVRNRFLWGLFAVIVCVCFIGVFTPTGNSDRRSPSKGRILNRNITNEEYARARFFELGLRHSPRNPEDEALVAELTWERIAIRLLAEKIGISCSPAEIEELKTRDPRFQVNGVFSEQQYLAAVQKYFETTREIFEEYVQDEIIMNKMLMLAGAMAWTAPYELNQRLISVTDVIKAEYVLISNTIDSASIKVTGEDARKIYDSNPELFRIPEKIRVKYLTFPVTSYLGQVEVPENAISNYYEDHLSGEYSWRDTNDVLITIPLADVSNKIARTLRSEAAVLKAKEVATEFAVTLMPDKRGKALDPAVACSNFGISPRTSVYFSIDEKIPDIEPIRAFSAAAFELAPDDPDRRVSDALVGSNNVYVFIADDRKDSRIPEFSEVEDDAVEMAGKRATIEAFAKEINSISQSVREAIASGKTFAQAVSRHHLKATTTEPFTAVSIMTNQMDFSEVLAPIAVKLDKGDVSEPMEIGTNTYILVYMAEKEPGDSIANEYLRPQLLGALTRYRGKTVLREWSRQILSESKVEQTDVETPEPEPPPPPREEREI